MKPLRSRPTARVQDASKLVAAATRDDSAVSGWTHNFYRYPARFSPGFASTVIQVFSKPGDLILDPYMGGGTSIVEGLTCGRNVVGNDLNSLAAFVTRVKTTPLNRTEVAAIENWATRRVPQFKYAASARGLRAVLDSSYTRNLELPRARFIKKFIAKTIFAAAQLPTEHARQFARCVVLRVSQWALDGKEAHVSLPSFRDRVQCTAKEMLSSLHALTKERSKYRTTASILQGDASELHNAQIFARGNARASLVITSPPYPGVHVLYHRWQVDGRRESPAPYWIAGCEDGEGGSYYNFGDRRDPALVKYFQRSLQTLKSIRKVTKTGGTMVQLIAFNRPAVQLPRYLENMAEAGFDEIALSHRRIWRTVPGRKWHARQLGRTNSSKEVLLVHRAI